MLRRFLVGAVLVCALIFPAIGAEKSSVINSMDVAAKAMDQYTEKVGFQWLMNPFNRPKTDKNFSPWTDPLAYNSYWYVYYPPKVDTAYDRNKFKLDNVIFYHSPQLGTSVNPIAFGFDDLKYRFYIGVGFLWNGYFMMYGKGASQLYGTHLFLNSVIQVEPFIDFIYKDNLRIRLTPIRHICYHMSGDILGDSALHQLDSDIDPNTPLASGCENYKDVGFEQVHLSANYRLGWFNFYGGLAGAVTNYDSCSYINLLYFYSGTEMRFPIWGDLKLIAGIHVGGNYDKLADLKHNLNDNTYEIINPRYQLTPIISAGIGFGIDNWVMGLKFDYGRTRQIYALDYMESRIGFSACLML